MTNRSDLVSVLQEQMQIFFERIDETEGCRLRQEETTEKKFPLQTGRRCRCCKYELYWSSYDKEKLLRLQPMLTNNMVQSYNCDEAFKQMKQSLERGDVEKFDEKWSKMFGIRQAYWKHPRGSKFARRYGFPKEGYEAVVKKRFRETYVHLRRYGPTIVGTVQRRYYCRRRGC
jgi:hypothetical protein